MSKSKIIVATASVTIVMLFVIGATFVYSGIYDVSASRSHTGLVGGTLHELATQSIARRAATVAVPAMDSATIATGALPFHEMCVGCHSAPGVPRDETGEGLNPLAPELSKEAAHLSEQEIFWITKHGIKFSGMPGFGTSHTDEQLWAMVKFVKLIEGMTEKEYEDYFRPLMQEAKPAATHMHAPGTPTHTH